MGDEAAPKLRAFPERFVFGCATSAYQIEGGITNDWSAWEAAGRLKDKDARNGLATDHWARWEQDFDLLAALGVGAYRLSIEWARVEPERGRYDQAAIAQYGRMLAGLRARGVEPFVTLLHFTHPPWFHGTSPWHEKNDAPQRFAAFAERIAEIAAPHVQRWTVLNEPGVWLVGAYLAGVIPPGVRGLKNVAAAGAALLRAHGLATQKIRAARADAEIGVAHNVLRFAPSRAFHPIDRLAAAYVSRQFNHAIPRAFESGVFQLGETPGLRFVEPVPEAKGTLDFLGINYYSRVHVDTVLGRPFGRLSYDDREGRGISDLGWEIHPRGLTELLLEMKRYGRPIYITENGIDDRSDTRRAAFLHDHLGAVLDAVDRGVDVRGYFHWSLLDNFEWLEGYPPRFGLYRVDYPTQARTLTKGGEHYRTIIERRALPSVRPPEEKRLQTKPTPVIE
jgi:beta-glucosidase